MNTGRIPYKRFAIDNLIWYVMTNVVFSWPYFPPLLLLFRMYTKSEFSVVKCWQLQNSHNCWKPQSQVIKKKKKSILHFHEEKLFKVKVVISRSIKLLMQTNNLDKLLLEKTQIPTVANCQTLLISTMQSCTAGQVL